MFGLFKKKSPALKNGAGIPAPLQGFEDCVGGIESLTLDGTLYFFGFAPGGDIVVSPLISSLDTMARFASMYMEQTDGKHDQAYWREVAGYALEGSELCDDPAERTFNTQALAATVASLARVRREGTPEPGFAVGYHLRYLLEAASGWQEAEGYAEDDVDALIAFIAGEESMPDTTLPQAATQLQKHLGALVTAAPGNWATLFAALKS